MFLVNSNSIRLQSSNKKRLNKRVVAKMRREYIAKSSRDRVACRPEFKHKKTPTEVDVLSFGFL
ncbi:hypothetical protein VCR29J2_450160 [Vibrio coralliirubri]|nr:hypothetical protein VCR29J2_450160 [Vibrio coralliirubri]